MKADSNGLVEWTRQYGGSGHEAGISVQQTLDGGYVVLGTISTSEGYQDIYLIK